MTFHMRREKGKANIELFVLGGRWLIDIFTFTNSFCVPNIHCDSFIRLSFTGARKLLCELIELRIPFPFVTSQSFIFCYSDDSSLGEISKRHQVSASLINFHMISPFVLSFHLPWMCRIIALVSDEGTTVREVKTNLLFIFNEVRWDSTFDGWSFEIVKATKTHPLISMPFQLWPSFLTRETFIVKCSW